MSLLVIVTFDLHQAPSNEYPKVKKALAKQFRDLTSEIVKDNGSYRYKIVKADGSYSNGGWTLILWSIWWFTVAVVYFLFPFSRPTFFLQLIFSDIGSLMALAAAFAYCRGDSFEIRDLLPLGLLVIVIPVVEMMTSTLITGPQGRVIAMGPSLVLSVAAMLAIGWCILVRCGWRSAWHSFF